MTLKIIQTQASTIAALKEQVAGARNAALEEAAKACAAMESDMFDQYKGRGKHAPNNEFRADPYMNGQSDGAGQCVAAIRALASQPAAPTADRNSILEEAALAIQSMGSASPIMSYGMLCADAIREMKGKPAAPVQPTEAELIGIVSAGPDAILHHLQTRHADRAAPPVQQPDDVRDLHAEIMNLRADVSNCSITSASAEIGYKQGHRDARHAAAELVASVGQALATTRPGAALTEEALRAAMKKAFSFGQNYWQQADSDFASQNKKADVTRDKFIQLTEDTCAILAASGGAEPVVPEEDVSYELIQNDELVASAAGFGAWGEILRYAAQYKQDGPVEIIKCIRTPATQSQQGEGSGE